MEHKTLTEALVAFQAELPSVKKGNTAKVASQKGSYSYQYADLTDITEIAMPLLTKHGLAFTSRPTMTENGFVLAYTLRHTSGGSESGEYPLPDPSHNPAQTIGSAITYARRYSLCAATGIAPGGDDDDAGAAQDANRTRRTAQKRSPGAQVAIQRITHAGSLDELRDVWEALTPDVRAVVDVLQAKDARKAELEVPIDEAWAPVAEVKP